MTQREREQEVRRRLYHYAQYKRELKEYEDDVLNGTPQHDDSGIRGTDISDPAARAGIALADMPKHLQEKRRWCEAIEAALGEMHQMDGQDRRGLAYICTQVYGLDGRKRFGKNNVGIKNKVAYDCNLSISAMYYRIGVITTVVMFHAADLLA